MLMPYFGNGPKLRENEVRVIKTDRKAIVELLFEKLLDIGRERLEIPFDFNDYIFRMALDDTMDTLTFYAVFASKEVTPDVKYIG